MGNGVVSCCEASSSMQDEMTILSPRTLKSPSNRSILNEVSQIRLQSSPEFKDTQKRIQTLKSLTLTSMLIIKVINSGPIAKDTRLAISHLGLEGSKRQANDGKVFFGSKRKEYGKTVNDIVIPLQKENQSDKFRGRHFVIVYNIEKDRFFIKDLGKGFGVYMRINFPIVLKDNAVINIGSSFLIFGLSEDKSPVLSIRIMGEENDSNQFDPIDYIDDVITLGRGITCTLRFEDTLLSKVHSYISYVGDKWILTDGDQQKNSTNGTWVYIADETLVFSSMIFKSNQCVFQVVSASHNSEHIA